MVLKFTAMGTIPCDFTSFPVPGLLLSWDQEVPRRDEPRAWLAR